LVIFEAENHPPVSGNGHRVKSGQIALELVELQTGDVHIVSGASRGEQGEDLP
jgi:hypothetical protein